MSAIQKAEFIKAFIARHATVLAIGALGILILASFFSDFIADVLFALFVVLVAESFALLLSNVAAFVYTQISFTRGIFYGEDNKLSASERGHYAKVLGSVIVAVHVLVAIVVSMLYWGKLGG